jgi:hypothetical protein
MKPLPDRHTTIAAGLCLAAFMLFATAALACEPVLSLSPLDDAISAARKEHNDFLRRMGFWLVLPSPLIFLIGLVAHFDKDRLPAFIMLAAAILMLAAGLFLMNVKDGCGL